MPNQAAKDEHERKLGKLTRRFLALGTQARDKPDWLDWLLYETKELLENQKRRYWEWRYVEMTAAMRLGQPTDEDDAHSLQLLWEMVEGMDDWAWLDPVGFDKITKASAQFLAMVSERSDKVASHLEDEPVLKRLEEFANRISDTAASFVVEARRRYAGDYEIAEEVKPIERRWETAVGTLKAVQLLRHYRRHVADVSA